MKSIYILALILILPVTHSCAQQTSKPSKPFTIEGQLKNFRAKEIYLLLRDNDHTSIVDTIPVDSQGKFYFINHNAIGPQQALLSRRDANFFTNIFVAPGYDLTITADCENLILSKQTEKVTGYGSQNTQYLLIRDSIFTKRGYNSKWFDFRNTALVAFESSAQKLSDSVLQVVYNKKSPHDNYSNFFYKYNLLSNSFEMMDHLTWQTISDSTLNYQQTIDFVAKNTDPVILADLFNDKYIMLDTYNEFMTNGYVGYLQGLERKRGRVFDPRNYRSDFLRIIDGAYKGKIKSIVLYNQMYSAVEFCRSFEELNRYKKTFPEYLAQIPNESKKENIQKLITGKETELMNTAIGNPAPAFTAQDSTGKKYQLADYKGKVVYLDLWASWCGPCRYQTPYLKKIYDKYKNDSRIAIISIAVLDKQTEWKKAMIEDKPTWLQLFDIDGTVQRGYVANSIPKFIIIDKQGKIASLDALDPHSGAELEKLLDEKMANN